ncbi:MAG: flippase [Patescibacteria group bacterium]
MSVGKALAKNSVFQIGGKVMGTVFGLVTFYFMLEFFDTDGFGLFTTAITYVSIFAIVVDFGLTLTTTQMISEKGADEPKILGNLLTLRLISAFVFMSLAPLCAPFVPRSEGIMDLIIIASISYFFGSIAQMFVGVFQKRLVILTAVLAEAANRFLALLGILMVGVLGWGLEGAMIAFLIGGVAQLTIILLATARKVHLRPQIDLSVWRDIVTRSWPIGVSIFFNLLYLKGDIFFMWIFDRSAEEIGQYGSAYKVIDVMTVIPVTFMGLLLPLLTLAWSQKKPQEFKAYLQNGFDLMVILALPLATGVAITGVPIMTAVQPDLVLAGQVLAVLGPAAGVVYLGALYGHTIVAIGKQKIMTWGYVAVAIVAITGYILYIPEYGAWAAAWITLVSEALITILTFAVVTRTIGNVTNVSMLARAVVASLVMTGAILIIPSPHVLLTVFAGAAIYIVTLTALGGPKLTHVIDLFRAEKPPITP